MRWNFLGALLGGAAVAAMIGACSSSSSSPDQGDAGASDGGGGITNPGVADEGGTIPTDAGSTDAPTPPPNDGGGEAAPPAGTSPAGKLATALRGKPQFLFGMGNDLDANGDHDKDGAFTLGTTLDLHDVTLYGVSGQNGGSAWPDQAPNGGYIDQLAAAADKHGTTPMFNLYSMEENLGLLQNDTWMSAYWPDVKLLFQRLGAFGKPAVVQLEHDLWVQGMEDKADGTTPAKVTAYAPDCAGLTDDLRGFGACLVKLARMYAPKTAIGFHVVDDGAGPAAVATYMKLVSADKGDFLVVMALDRDAGCYEAGGPDCPQGSVDTPYWDETNAKSPNFHDHFAAVKALHDGIGGLPVIWWSLPFGVPSDTPGGTAGHYRDNRVHYFFQHVDELAAAGGVAAVFGTIADGQTTWTSDGDQFKNAVAGYAKKPFTLP